MKNIYKYIHIVMITMFASGFILLSPIMLDHAEALGCKDGGTASCVAVKNLNTHDGDAGSSGGSGNNSSGGSGNNNSSNAGTVDGCGGAETSIIKCDQNNSGSSLENNGVWGLLLIAINILTAGVGVAALGGIIYGAVLYTSAGGNPEQVKKAKGIFVNVAIGVVAFAAMFFFLNFLIPGGIISA